jgi:hypothetical protein
LRQRSVLYEGNPILAGIGASALPTDPAVVGTYLATIAETKSVATIWSPSRKRTKLPVCRIRSRSAPMQSLLGGIVRTKTVAQTRKDALTQLVPYEPPLLSASPA